MSILVDPRPGPQRVRLAATGRCLGVAGLAALLSFGVIAPAAAQSCAEMRNVMQKTERLTHKDVDRNYYIAAYKNQRNAYKALCTGGAGGASQSGYGGAVGHIGQAMDHLLNIAALLAEQSQRRAAERQQRLAALRLTQAYQLARRQMEEGQRRAEERAREADRERIAAARRNAGFGDCLPGDSLSDDGCGIDGLGDDDVFGDSLRFVADAGCRELYWDFEKDACMEVDGPNWDSKANVYCPGVGPGCLANWIRDLLNNPKRCADGGCAGKYLHNPDDWVLNEVQYRRIAAGEPYKMVVCEKGGLSEARMSAGAHREYTDKEFLACLDAGMAE